MKVERNGVIAGQKIKVVRDMLRGFGPYHFTLDAIIEHLQRTYWHGVIEQLFEQGLMSRDSRNYSRKNWRSWMNGKRHYGVKPPKMPSMTAQAHALLDQLLSDGIVEPAGDDPNDFPVPKDGNDYYRCTIKGNGFRMTGLVPRMNRAKAEALLKDVLKRVAEINAKADLLHWVTEVRVFGSYLTDTDDLGDLDLAIKIERRRAEGNFVNACVEQAKRSGKRFASFTDMMDYPELEVRRRIKNRSPRISIHDTEELDRHPEWGAKTIYTFVPPS